MALFYTPYMILQYYKYEWCVLLRLALPVAFTIVWYLGYRRKFGWIKLLIPIFVAIHQLVLHNILSDYYRQSLVDSTSYLLNISINGNVIKERWQPDVTPTYNVQTGRRYYLQGAHSSGNYTIVKMSLDDFIICVYKDDPSPAEIQKYMEPVLFIDGVEQPRPEYDDLKLSDAERRVLLREHHIEVARVVKKERDKFLRNLVTLQVNDTVQKTVNLMYKDEPDYEDIFESLNEESYVLVKVSDINPKVIEVADWQPTAEKIKKVRNQMRKPIIATIYDKHLKQVHWGSQIKRFYMVRLQFSDTITDYIKIEDIRHRQIFESLHVGDTVLIKLTEGKTKSVDVLDWQPTPEEIEKYKTPVRLIEKN